MGNKKPVGSPGNSGILQHTFNFDPTFYNVHVPANSELKFFSEIFSLIDAMRERDTLHQLTKKIREVEGIFIENKKQGKHFIERFFSKTFIIFVGLCRCRRM